MATDFDYSYAWEKLWNAVSGMAEGTDTLQQRLVSAWSYSLANLMEMHFPKRDLWSRLSELQREASTKQHPTAGSFAATLTGFTDEAAREHAKAITALFGEVDDLYHGE